MRNVPWYEQANPDVFFPRCYRLSHNEDKEAFIGNEEFRHLCLVNHQHLIQYHFIVWCTNFQIFILCFTACISMSSHVNDHPYVNNLS